VLEGEVDKQTDSRATESQVRQELRLVYRMNMVGRVDLDDHLSLDQNVDPGATVNLDAITGNGKQLLGLIADTPRDFRTQTSAFSSAVARRAQTRGQS
jgi:hypothetical protein